MLIDNLKLTPEIIPKQINEKNNASSYWLLTGVLYLTIDSAPIIPSERYRLVAITVVTARTKGASINEVNIKALFNKYLYV